MSRSDEKQGKRPTAPVARGTKVMSVGAALAHVLQLAQTLDKDTHETRERLPSGRTRASEQDAPSSPGGASPGALAHERLLAALKELPPETALKLRTLMV